MSKRIISAVLTLVMLLGMLPLSAFATESPLQTVEITETPVSTEIEQETTLSSDTGTVTRAQWLQMLVSVFGYSIEDGVVPDNYFPDLDPNAEYYDDILVAVYHGLVDVLPNSPLQPEAAATREFAAFTLNACMGYLPEGTPAFTEAADTAYPDDIQVAIEQGWFALTDGAFLPEQPITAAEFDAMKADAESYVAAFTIESGHESQYTFLDGVIEITEKADITVSDGVTTITIVNCAQSVAAGDKFVVYSGGLAIPYQAESVTVRGTTTVITASDIYFEDAIKTMDVQLETDADPANYYAAEDTELIFIEESTGEEYTQQDVMEQMASGSKSVYIPKYSKTLDLGNGVKFALSVELKNAKVCHAVDIGLLSGSASVWMEMNTEVSGKLSCALDEFSGDDIEVYIGGYEVPGIGGLGVYVKVDVTGSISVVKKYFMKVGLKVGYDTLSLKGYCNKIYKLTDKGSSINAELSAKIYLEVKFGLYGKAMPIKGYLYGEGGFKASVKYTTYEEIEGNCIHFAAYLYAEYGAKVEWGFLGWEDELEWTKEFIKESNSPVKLGFHYEDGIQVGSCTREDLEGTTTGDPSKIADSGYSTGSNSSYAGSGMSSGGSSTGYNSGGEPVIIYTYSLDDSNNATITGYSGNATSLTIPLKLDGYDVVAIGSNAFKNNTTIRTIIMQDNILTIGSSAFYGCSNLRNLTLSESLTTIGSNAFQNCSSLTTVNIPDTVTSIGEYSFQNCVNLAYVNLSANISTIGNSAFRNCSKITSIYIPKSLTSAGNENWGYDKSGAFHSCSGLNTVTFEEGVTEIPKYLFTNCTGIESITIPNTVTIIEERAFSYATNLKTVIFGSSITTIDAGAFAECTSLEAADLSDTITSIGEYAFANCTNMATLNLPKYLTTLRNRAFYNCISVTEVHIPKSLTSAGNEDWGYDKSGAFHSCSGLKTVTFEEGVTEIPKYLFTNCTGIESITIPDTVTIIEERAFYLCPNLKSVVIPDSVTQISSSSLRSSGLLEVTIPESVTNLGANVLSACTSLETVNWPSSLTAIPEYSFSGCTALTTVNLPDNLKAIHKHAFNNCDSLVTFTMPDSVTTMAENVFYDCDALTDIHLSANLQKINGSTFYDCDALTSITIPYGVTSIGNSAFYDCDALETVDMANSVTSLGTNVFYHNDVLKNVTLSRNLTSIPTGTFKECALLEEIVIPYFATSIGDNAFNSSPKLTKVVTHDKLASINSTAFSYADVTQFYGPAGSYTETWCAENGYTFNENTSAATSVTLKETAVSIPKGKTYQLDFDVAPADFADAITFRSSNTAVVTVDETGKLTAVAPGSATIRVNVGSASASCKVTVTQAVTKIALNKTTLALEVPNTYQLTATITPTDASNQVLAWTSSNEAAATVDANGLVTAVGNGTAVITAAATDGSGISASCTVTVTDPNNMPVSGITLDKTSLSMEALDTCQLTAAITPANAANKVLAWTSSDETVATMDANGVVTAIAKGTATITAAATDDSGVTASCTVTVTNNAYVVTDVSGLESSHNYPLNCTDFWLYTVPGADALLVTFDARTYIEDEFDFLYIYDGEGNRIGTYTGGQLAGVTVEIPGDTVKIQLDSDDVGTDWGFKVTEVKVQKQTTVIASGWSGATQWTLTDDGVLTICGEGNMKNYAYGGGQPWLGKGVDITSVVIEEGVVSVGSGAFRNLTTLKSVTFPETTMTKMGEAAFYGSGLESVEIPASLWTIQPYTFKNCANLTSVTFHEGNLQKISDGAFYGTGLTELVLPDCLDILDVYAFKGCANLISITIGSSLTELREAVFYGTAIPTITIPEGITKIGPYAFKNCVKLETVDFPSTLTSVGEASFYADTALKTVELPGAVTTIGNYAFRKCAAIEELTFGTELTSIGECAFYGCTGLTEIVIPNKVTTIKPYAFKTCTGLTSVTLGSKVSTIGEGAFNTCTGLKTIIFPASLTAIGDYCFSGSYNLWKMTFQGDAPTIGTGAFKGLTATAYYPGGNTTWTSANMLNYGGKITWSAQ